VSTNQYDLKCDYCFASYDVKESDSINTERLFLVDELWAKSIL